MNENEPYETLFQMCAEMKSDILALSVIIGLMAIAMITVLIVWCLS